MYVDHELEATLRHNECFIMTESLFQREFRQQIRFSIWGHREKKKAQRWEKKKRHREENVSKIEAEDPWELFA